jgi:hypothetical protein
VTNFSPTDPLIGKLARKAKIASEQRSAFQSDLLDARGGYLANVRHAADERPDNEAEALAEIVESILRFRRAVERLPEFRRMRETLTRAPMAVRSIALPPSGQSGETALPEATLLLLPELLKATEDYVAQRRIGASERVEHHRPTGAAARNKHLALVLYYVAKKYSPQLSAAEMKGWLYDAMTWCGVQARHCESRSFQAIVKYVAARWEAAH